MPDQPEEVFSAQLRVQILFEEYKTLRAEILSRTNNGYQLWGIGAAVLTWLISRPVDAKYWVMMALFAIVFPLASWTTFRDISKAAKRIRELEHHINELAGAHLLEWESRWGSEATGYFGTGKPLPRQRV